MFLVYISVTLFQTKEETTRSNILKCETAVQFRITWQEGTIMVSYGGEIANV